MKNYILAFVLGASFVVTLFSLVSAAKPEAEPSLFHTWGFVFDQTCYTFDVDGVPRDYKVWPILMTDESQYQLALDDAIRSVDHVFSDFSIGNGNAEAPGITLNMAPWNDCSTPTPPSAIEMVTPTTPSRATPSKPFVK